LRRMFSAIYCPIDEVGHSPETIVRSSAHFDELVGLAVERILFDNDADDENAPANDDGQVPK
jgi:hypothetical protein